MQSLVLFGYPAVGPLHPDYPFGRVRGLEPSVIRQVLLESPYSVVLGTFFDGITDEPGMLDWKEVLVGQWTRELPEQTVRQSFEQALTGDLRQRLPAVRVPTLVIAAERDAFPVESLRYMAEQVEGARFALIEGRSHCAPVTAPGPLRGDHPHLRHHRIASEGGLGGLGASAPPEDLP